jgi:hypothetical protein
MNSLVPPATPASGAQVSGAGVTQPPVVQTQVPGLTYPGTGAGNYPPPALTNPYPQIPTPPYPATVPAQAYPTANQQLPLTYPYMTPGTPLASPGVVQSYHAVIGEHEYMDHRGRRRKYIGERHIKDIIGSTEDADEEVFDLIE